MKKFWGDKSKFFCFTPEVMLATFLVETALAAYVFIRYKMTAFSRLVILILLMLAGFQFAEYQICGNYNSIFWSRIGFIIITFLPVLGLHLISLLTGRKNFLKLGYTLLAVYILIFAFAPKAITGATCGGNYIIFNTNQELSWTYSAYYFGFLLLGVWEAANELIKSGKKIMYWMILSYASFMVPMGLIYAISPAARQAIPSTMCGFALLMAFILAFKVISQYYSENHIQ